MRDGTKWTGLIMLRAPMQNVHGCRHLEPDTGHDGVGPSDMMTWEQPGSVLGTWIVRVSTPCSPSSRVIAENFREVLDMLQVGRNG